MKAWLRTPTLLCGGALLLSCSQGGGERIDPLSLAPPVEVQEPEPEPPPEIVEAYVYAPSTEAVFGLDPAYGFECADAPGSRVAQRLNRREYDNTVRDLLGVSSRPAREFPKDGFGDSFDNNARALTVSPVLTEAYVKAAESLAAEAMAPDGEARLRLVPCTAKDDGVENCAEQVLSPLLTRAFRRPVSEEELARYVAIVSLARDQGGDFDEGLRAAIEAMLLSPNFLFRLELDVDPESQDFHTLTQYELASRLSYFLWSSMPDESLFEAARNNELVSAEAVLAQVDRMLDDPKSDALLDAFAGQWLETADIGAVNQPAPDVFPEYTDDLRLAMQEETRLLMRDVLRGELPFSSLLTTEETYLNRTLADFYGIEGEFEDAVMSKGSLQGTQRRGLLTHGSVLTLTSASTRTSPVRRGVFVLTNLLCDAPLPPPPDVQGDLASTQDAIDDSLPLAERTRLHSEDPACAGCHVLMDPIGLGLENFDAIGRYRTTEFDQNIDASGELYVDGEFVPFEGPLELSELLAEDERLPECAVQKIYTFALGRVPDETRDPCRTQWLQRQFEAAGYNFRELIRMVTLTDSFRGRHGGLLSSQSQDQESTEP